MLRLVGLPGRLVLGRLIERRHTGVDHRSAAIGAEVAGKRGKHQLALAALECSFNAIQPGLDDFVRQLEILEPLQECCELFFLATLELLGRFLIVAPPGVTFRKKPSD